MGDLFCFFFYCLVYIQRSAENTNSVKDNCEVNIQATTTQVKARISPVP